ncbi:MAG TPA: hypothetical protein VJQ56_10045 [Blastocatellia bacterium]|nr:hypothetical protein [Blastocatellia bacterium]
MKPRARFLAPTLGVCFMIIAAGTVSAQCVTCKPSRLNPDILVCGASSSGGYECQANDQTCVISGACPGSRPPTKPPVQDIRIQGAIEIDPQVIREVGQLHPRFAVALAFLAKRGLIGRDAKVFMIPVAVTQIDVEESLRGLEDGGSLREGSGLARQEGQLGLSDLGLSNQQPRHAPRKDAPLVVYDVTVEQISDSLAAIRFQAESRDETDPAYSSLEVQIATDPGEKRWKAVRWEVK